jgi:hypothetical protein
VRFPAGEQPLRMTINRAEFLKRIGAVGVVASAGAVFGTGPADASTSRLVHRGITYDTGTYFGPGPLTRERWSRRLMAMEMRAISEDLHCTSVQVHGSDLVRLTESAAEALRRGMHVWVQPRLFDHPQEEVLDHLARTADMAERLRRRNPAVGLNVGCEAPLFTPGIVPGETWQERMETVGDPNLDWEAVFRRLNDFLGRAVSVARARFCGEITYAAATWEVVDWTPFDVVGVDYYAFYSNRADHIRELSTYKRWRKPITICEFGTSAFVGAPETEGGGWAIVDHSGPVPVITGDHVRSERVQADHIGGVIDVFESAGIHSAYVYTFIQPDMPHSPNRRFDLDMAGFGVVAVIRDDHIDPRSPYRWRPKLAFNVIARRYGNR